MTYGGSLAEYHKGNKTTQVRSCDNNNRVKWKLKHRAVDTNLLFNVIISIDLAIVLVMVQRKGFQTRGKTP